MTNDNNDRELEDLLGAILYAEKNTTYRVRQSKLRILEALYKDRGLRFEDGPWGDVPVQIYGEIDGLRFYFRLRYNRASIILGPVNEVLDSAVREKSEEYRKDRLEKHLAECEDERCFYCTTLKRPTPEKRVADYYPSEVFAEASLDPVGEPGDFYNGSLELDEVIPVFRYLFENLNRVEKKDRIRVETLDLIDRDITEKPLAFRVMEELGDDFTEDRARLIIDEISGRLSEKYDCLYSDFDLPDGT